MGFAKIPAKKGEELRNGGKDVPEFVKKFSIIASKTEMPDLSGYKWMTKASIKAVEGEIKFLREMVCTDATPISKDRERQTPYLKIQQVHEHNCLKFKKVRRHFLCERNE